MVEMRFRARRSVVTRGLSGKLPSTWMSLSVRSSASWGYSSKGEIRQPSKTLLVAILPSHDVRLGAGQKGKKEEEETYACDTQILNGGDAVTCFNTDRRINSAPRATIK